MAVPAHDERDWAFAKKFGLPIIEVVAGGDVAEGGLYRHPGRRDGQLRLPERPEGGRGQKDHHRVADREGPGRDARSTSSCATGCSPASATGASPSRWSSARSAAGCRCPRISCPLTLPDVENYEPTDNGESPLAAHDRLGQHHLPALRRPRQARDRHHAPVGGLQLVLPALYRSAQRQGAGHPWRR